MKQVTKKLNPFFGGWRGRGSQFRFVYNCGMHLLTPRDKLTTNFLAVEDGEPMPPHDGVIKVQFDGRWRSRKFWFPETIVQFQKGEGHDLV